jgi:hypothetical protein
VNFLELHAVGGHDGEDGQGGAGGVARALVAGGVACVWQSLTSEPVGGSRIHQTHLYSKILSTIHFIFTLCFDTFTPLLLLQYPLLFSSTSRPSWQH